MTRQIVRLTANKLLRSDDLVAGEKEIAIAFLQANPQFGNPHIVRCGSCNETRTLFRDENDGPFKLASRGWLCEKCDMSAASQEIKF
jgi:hypothetical protein